jgi:hypothetical protein
MLLSLAGTPSISQYKTIRLSSIAHIHIYVNESIHIYV